MLYRNINKYAEGPLQYDAVFLSHYKVICNYHHDFQSSNITIKKYVRGQL
jgi:hypothetical protein